MEDERDTLRAEVERLTLHVLKAQQHALYMGNKAIELAAREVELFVEIERLDRITRHLVRTYIVSDDAYSPEAETDKAISRIKAQFSAT